MGDSQRQSPAPIWRVGLEKSRDTRPRACATLRRAKPSENGLCLATCQSGTRVSAACDARRISRCFGSIAELKVVLRQEAEWEGKTGKRKKGTFILR